MVKNYINAMYFIFILPALIHTLWSAALLSFISLSSFEFIIDYAN